MKRVDRALKLLEGSASHLSMEDRIALITKAIDGLSPNQKFVTFAELAASMAQALGHGPEKFAEVCGKFYEERQPARDKADRLCGDYGERS
jgi:hypothetical protein